MAPEQICGAVLVQYCLTLVLFTVIAKSKIARALYYTCLLKGVCYRWYHHHPRGDGDDAPNALMINRPPALATGLSHVQMRVCLMCGVESALCAVFSLCYGQSSVCVMCSL